MTASLMFKHVLNGSAYFTIKSKQIMGSVNGFHDYSIFLDGTKL